jgi:putative spermidine/putrescine transport system permease protein
MSFSASNLLSFPPPTWGLRWYRVFADSSLWTGALFFSARLAIACAVCSAVLGTALAVGLAKVRGRLAGIISAFVLAPLIVPILITAIGVYFASTYVNLSTFNSLLLVHTALSMPFVVLVVLTSLRQVDPNMERASRSLGADAWRSFRYVIFPIIAPSIAIGAVFAFQFSWDEVVIANFLSTPGNQTLPVVMWTDAKQTIEPTIAAASTLLSAVTGVLLFTHLIIQRRSMRLSARMTSNAEGKPDHA